MGSRVECRHGGGGRPTATMNAGGSGGGANGEVKTPIRSRAGNSDCRMEAGRLLAFKSSVSTSAFVRFDVLLVCTWTDILMSGTNFSVASPPSDSLRELDGAGPVSDWR